MMGATSCGSLISLDGAITWGLHISKMLPDRFSINPRHVHYLWFLLRISCILFVGFWLLVGFHSFLLLFFCFFFHSLLSRHSHFGGNERLWFRCLSFTNICLPVSYFSSLPHKKKTGYYSELRDGEDDGLVLIVRNSQKEIDFFRSWYSCWWESSLDQFIFIQLWFVYVFLTALA